MQSITAIREFYQRQELIIKQEKEMFKAVAERQDQQRWQREQVAKMESEARQRTEELVDQCRKELDAVEQQSLQSQRRTVSSLYPFPLFCLTQSLHLLPLSLPPYFILF
jgi:hypothetical protein